MLVNFNQDNSLAGWENVVFVSFGQAADEDLPQVESDEDVIIDLMQARTHHSRAEAEEEIHHLHHNEPA